MADTKVSALTALATEPADTDEFYINDGGVSKRIAWSTIKAVFALAAQGSLADTALQPADVGTAAAADTTDFATAAQGALADTALQPADVGTAAAADTTDFATAAQGDTADTAVQPADLEGTNILSTGEAGGTKFLRENGDGTCSWQAVSGSGDFLANGTVDMTGEFRTDVGTFDSDVADGASANAYTFNTAATYSTAGANLLRLQNNGTNVFDFSFQGGIDHVNSGASTAAHSQSLNLNWSANATQTSSGSHSAVIGNTNQASGSRAMAFGLGCTASAEQAIAMGNAATASANNAVAMGRNCTSSGQESFAAGFGNTASGRSATALGAECNSEFGASVAIGAGKFASTGDAQVMTCAMKAATTDATQTTLTAYATTLYALPADTSWVFSALVVGRSNEADGNDSGAYRIEGCLTRDESNNTALVGSITKTVVAESAGATAWDVTAEADDTNEALAIKVTGEAGTNIRWVAKVDIAQVTFA